MCLVWLLSGCIWKRAMICDSISAQELLELVASTDDNPTLDAEAELLVSKAEVASLANLVLAVKTASSLVAESQGPTPLDVEGTGSMEAVNARNLILRTAI